MYVITVVFEVEPSAATAFRARVQQQAADSLSQEPGCRRFDVCADPDRPERIFLYEIYDDAAAFDLHLASAHFKAFDADVASLVARKVVERWDLL